MQSSNEMPEAGLLSPAGQSVKFKNLDIDMAGVAFSYSRDRKKLEQLASDAGANAHVGTPVEAAHGTDVLLLAVHWTPVDDVLSQAGAFQRGDEHE